MSSAVGGAPPAHTSSDSLNGKTIPAIPSVNGNSSFDHGRKPSMTVTPAGATGYTPNGGALGGPQNKPNVQFGSMNAGGSPALGSTPPALAHQSNSSLGVNQLNHRVNSPVPSPSPIPQPANPSGGRPPSTFQGQGNGMVFGAQGEQGDPTGLARPLSQLQFGENHMRRNSSQSIHSDMGNPGLPTGPQGRPYGMQGGRGRGSYQGYQNHQGQPYGSPYNNRGGPNNRGGSFHPGPGRGGPQFQYQGSPHMGNRTPTMMNATPGGTPFMPPNQMMPQMQGPNGVPYFQVNHPPIPMPPGEPIRGKSGKRGRGAPRGTRGRGAGRGAHEDRFISRDPASDRYVPLPPDLSMNMAPVPAPQLFPLPDLSPASGNFEHFLTRTKQTAADPSIQQHYNQQMGYYPQMAGYPPYMPQSPRPPFQQGGYAPPMQQTYSNQPQPQNMSRQSSQMSVPDRPGSTLEQQPHTPSMPSQPPHTSSRTPSISTTKSNFSIPVKKSAAIQIKNAAGEIVDFKSQKPPASPAIAQPAQPSPVVVTPSAPTPPSRAESAAPESSHTRAESLSASKTDEEKRKAMQEAVKARIAAETKQDPVQEKAEEKMEIEAEEVDAAKVEAKEAETVAESLEKEASEAEKKVEAEEVSKVEEPSKVEEVSEAEEECTPTPVDEKKPEEETPEEKKPAADDEIDFDAIEAEMAAAEAEEARKEEEYAKKKAAAKEAQLKKEREEAENAEAEMKKAEREAEELELAREKEREAAGSEDDEAKRMFADLKKGGAATPASTDTPAIQTPLESGTATPVSDVSMGPPRSGLGPKRGKAAELTLDTKKPVEPPEPSATLKALQSARRVEDISKVTYPEDIASPNPALNQNAPAARGFKYDKAFLLQFQNIFKEKPSLDWDAKIRDALGDGETPRAGGSAKTPGMGNRSASRNLPPPGQNFGGMGSFGAGARTAALPPGTTSEQRFAASNAAIRGAPVGGGFAQFGRSGMGPITGRTPSNNPMAGIPGSPRGGGAGSSRGGSRAESKRSGHKGGKHMAEENRSMPLTAGMNVGTLQVSEGGWKPHSVTGSALGPMPGGDGHLDPGTVQRKVKAALNKMTPDKFDRIADQILEIAAQSKNESDGRTLRQVIQLTFEKATDEAHWASMYAMFCRKMLETMSMDIKDENIKDKNGTIVAGGNLFRKYLLNRCQEEFERGWKVNLPGRKEGETEEAVMLSDEYYIAAAAKRRGLGLVRFIGELFKLGMLTERIMHECVKKLVDFEGTPDEAEVESLTSLLRTIGKQLDDPESKAQGRMDAYFQRIVHMMNLPDLPSRLRFMLLDIIDLRKHNWVSKDANKGPKTIAEIHAEEQERARQAELQRMAQQTNRGRGGGGMPMGRGDARSFSYNQMPPPDNSNRVNTDDLRRLGNRNAARTASNTGSGSLGPSGMSLGPRTNSGRRGLGPGSLLARGEESGNSSRTGTPPAQKDKDKKDESSTNAFSALAALENEGPASPPSNPASPPSQKSQPNIDRARSRSPAKPTE